MGKITLNPMSRRLGTWETRYTDTERTMGKLPFYAKIQSLFPELKSRRLTTLILAMRKILLE